MSIRHDQINVLIMVTIPVRKRDKCRRYKYWEYDELHLHVKLGTRLSLSLYRLTGPAPRAIDRTENFETRYGGNEYVLFQRIRI